MSTAFCAQAPLKAKSETDRACELSAFHHRPDLPIHACVGKVDLEHFEHRDGSEHRCDDPRGAVCKPWLHARMFSESRQGRSAEGLLSRSRFSWPYVPMRSGDALDLASHLAHYRLGILLGIDSAKF